MKGNSIEYDKNSIILNSLYQDKIYHINSIVYVGKKNVEINVLSNIVTNQGDYADKIIGTRNMVKRNYKFTVVSDSALIKMSKRSIYAAIIVVFISYSNKFKHSTKRECNDGTLYITDDDLVDCVTMLYHDEKFANMSKRARLDIIKEYIEQLIEDKTVYRVRDISNKEQISYLENMYIIDPFEYSNGENVYDIYMYMQTQYERYKKSKYFISNNNVKVKTVKPVNNNECNNISDLDFKGYNKAELLNKNMTPQAIILKIMLIMYSNGKVSFKINCSKIASLSLSLFGITLRRDNVKMYITDLINDCVLEIDKTDKSGKRVKFSSLYDYKSIYKDVVSYIINKNIIIDDI